MMMNVHFRLQALHNFLVVRLAVRELHNLYQLNDLRRMNLMMSDQTKMKNDPKLSGQMVVRNCFVVQLEVKELHNLYQSNDPKKTRNDLMMKNEQMVARSCFEVEVVVHKTLLAQQ